MKKFVFINESEKCWLVNDINKHTAIAAAVENGYATDMEDFYYGLSDGQIQVFEVQKQIGKEK